jgi:hypothetical protein
MNGRMWSHGKNKHEPLCTWCGTRFQIGHKLILPWCVCSSFSMYSDARIKRKLHFDIQPRQQTSNRHIAQHTMDPSCNELRATAYLSFPLRVAPFSSSLASSGPTASHCVQRSSIAGVGIFVRSLVSVFFSFVHTNNNKIETNNVYQRPFGPFLQRSVDPRSIADPRCLMMCGAGFCRGGPCLTNECATSIQDRINQDLEPHTRLVPLRNSKAVELELALGCAGLLRYLPYGT